MDSNIHSVWEKSKFSSQLIRKFLKYFVFNSKYLEISKLLSSRVGVWVWAELERHELELKLSSAQA
jgi:hypothetical protein